MIFSIKDNLLYQDGKQVKFIDTPNKSAGNILPKYLIEHYTGDLSPSSTISWFQNKDAKVSAHLLIDRKGSITQFVRFNKRAWHAGTSSYKGIEGLNSFSIGIELTNAGKLVKKGTKYYFGKVEVPADQVIQAKHKNEDEPAYWQTFTAEQINVCKQVSQLLVRSYSLKDVLGHDDIAPGRKSDPGPAFPMDQFKVPTILEIEKQMKTTSNLNLRTGAGTSYKATEVIPKGDTVTELLREGSWSRINYMGRLGWVSNQYLKA